LRSRQGSLNAREKAELDRAENRQRIEGTELAKTWRDNRER
jgi:hypothetical protein